MSTHTFAHTHTLQKHTLTQKAWKTLGSPTETFGYEQSTTVRPLTLKTHSLAHTHTLICFNDVLRITSGSQNFQTNEKHDGNMFHVIYNKDYSLLYALHRSNVFLCGHFLYRLCAFKSIKKFFYPCGFQRLVPDY